MSTESLTFTLDGARYTLTRLDDAEFSQRCRHSLVIAEDQMFQISFALLLGQRGERLSLGEMYVALKHLVGESGRCYDPWKGAYDFPFALTVRKGDREFAYLFEVKHYRSAYEFRLRKQVTPDDPRYQDRESIHKPFADEFSGDEINRLIMRFYSFVLGYWEGIRETYDEPFVLQAPANLILFGYSQRAFFEREYDSFEEYDAALGALQAQVEHERQGQTAGKVDPFEGH